MLELEFIAQCVLDMFRKPQEFFKEISRKELNLVTPVVVLLITGVLMGIMVHSQIPKMREQWKKTGTDLVYNIEYRVRAKKVEGFLYPIWLFVWWFLFTVAFATLTSSLGGWGDYKGFFNCTSFLIYPFALLQLLKFVLLMVPPLMFIYWLLLTGLSLWCVYALVQIAMGAGELDVLNAIVAAVVPAFFFLLLYLAYSPIVSMIVISHKV